MFDMHNIRGDGDLATDLIKRQEDFATMRKDAIDAVNYSAVGRWVLVLSPYGCKSRIGLVTRVNHLVGGDFVYLVSVMQWRYPSKDDFPRDRDGFYKKLRHKSDIHYWYKDLKFLDAPRAEAGIDFRKDW